MSTQVTNSNSSDKPAPQPQVASPIEGIWDVQVTGGKTIHQIKYPTIVQGLREGWITLDDTVSKSGENAWKSIREAFAKSFEVAAFLDPPRAYAREYGSIAGGLLAFVLIFGGFLYSGVELIGLELAGAFGFAIGLLIAIIGLSRGNLLISAVGLGIAAVLAGAPVSEFLNLGFLLGLSVGAALTGLAGWVIGYGPGYLIGMYIGSQRRDQYQLPAIRQPIPETLEKELPQKIESDQPA